MVEIRKSHEFDFRNGAPITEFEVDMWIERIVQRFSENPEETRQNISSGNTAVLAIRWGNTIEIYVTQSYVKHSYKIEE